MWQPHAPLLLNVILSDINMSKHASFSYLFLEEKGNYAQLICIYNAHVSVQRDRSSFLKRLILICIKGSLTRIERERFFASIMVLLACYTHKKRKLFFASKIIPYPLRRVFFWGVLFSKNVFLHELLRIRYAMVNIRNLMHIYTQLNAYLKWNLTHIFFR